MRSSPILTVGSLNKALRMPVGSPVLVALGVARDMGDFDLVKALSQYQDGTHLCAVISIPGKIAKRFPKADPGAEPHVTVVYFGDIPREKVGAVMGAVIRAVSETPPFGIKLSDQVSYFSPTKNSDGKRVAKIAVESPGLLRLHASIKKIATSNGIAVDKDFPVYRPHTTLAYLKSGADYSGPVPSGSWTQDHIEFWGFKDRFKIPLRGSVAKGLLTIPLPLYSPEYYALEKSMQQAETLIRAGLVDEAIDLLKSASHKYLRRVPTGKPHPKYRYIYSITSQHHDANFEEGEKIRTQGGHFEVTKKHDDGTVTVRHDTTGETRTIQAKELHQAFLDHHRAEITAAAERMKKVHAAAMKYGSPAQQARAKETMTRFYSRSGLAPHKTAGHRAGHMGDKLTAYDHVMRQLRAQASGEYGESQGQGGGYLGDYDTDDAKVHAWRAHQSPKPRVPATDYDAINEHLGLKGNKRVRSLFDGWNKLTANITRWDDPKMKDALDVMRQLPGLKGIAIPEAELTRQGEKAMSRAAAEPVAEAKPKDLMADYDRLATSILGADEIPMGDWAELKAKFPAEVVTGIRDTWLRMHPQDQASATKSVVTSGVAFARAIQEQIRKAWRWVARSPTWQQRTTDALLDTARKSTGSDDYGVMLSWLSDHRLRLPTVDGDGACLKSQNAYLAKYGTGALRLGVPLAGHPEKKVIFSLDLAKSRTKGAVGKKTEGRGRYGAIVMGGKVRYLSASEAAHAEKIAGIVQRYQRAGKMAEYVRPDLARWHEMARNMTPQQQQALASVTRGHVEQGQLVAHARVVKPEHQTKTVIDLQRQVANWQPPSDYVAVVNPLATPKSHLARLKHELATGEFKNQYPVDMGFSPESYPMAYLLSLGWHKQKPDGTNDLNRSELSALLYEFAPVCYGAANSQARRLRLTGAQTDDLRSQTEDWLFHLAQKWNPAERGDPGRESNFARYLWGSVNKQVHHLAMGILRSGKKEAPTEHIAELAHDPDRQTYTGEEFAGRAQSVKRVQEAIDRVLSPAEKTVFLSRLNIINPVAEGTTTGEVGEVKGWEIVREDLDHLPGALSDLSNYQLQHIFYTALQKLKDLPHHGYTHEQLSSLRDLATSQQSAMAGRRADWQGQEGVAPLIVHKNNPSTDELKHRIAELDKRRVSVKYQLALASEGPDRERLTGERRDLAHEYLELVRQLRGVSKSLVVCCDDPFGSMAEEMVLWDLGGR